MQQRSPKRLDLPDVIAAAWTACVRNWRLLLTISAIGAIAVAALSFPIIRALPAESEGEGVTTEQFQDFIREVWPYGIASSVVQGLIYLVLVAAALAIVRGTPPGIGPSFGAAARALRAWFPALVIMFILLALTFTIFLTPIGLYFLIAVLFTPQVILDEGAGMFAAMRRSRNLVRGLWWRTFLVSTAIALLWMLAQFVIGRIGSIGGSDAAAAITTGIAALVGAPFLAMGHTILYIDTRGRKGEPLRPLSPTERAAL